MVQVCDSAVQHLNCFNHHLHRLGCPSMHCQVLSELEQRLEHCALLFTSSTCLLWRDSCQLCPRTSSHNFGKSFNIWSKVDNPVLSFTCANNHWNSKRHEARQNAIFQICLKQSQYLITDIATTVYLDARLAVIFAGGGGFYIISKSTRLYRCARVVTDLVESISTKWILAQLSETNW